MPNSLSTINHALSTELISDEIKFLIACCQTDPSENDKEFILSYLQTQDIDLNILIKLANQHGILPLVYKTLLALNSDTSIVKTKEGYNNNHSIIQHSTFNIQHFLSELKPYYMAIVQKNMLMSAELLKLMKLLKGNEIDALSFKGPTLSQTAYGDITLRQFGDLDILTHRRDRYKMMDLLIKEGYIPEIDLKERTSETFFDCVNVIGFHYPSTGVRVEVHWELLSRNYAIDWKEKSVWEKQESVHINNKEVPVLSLEQLLLYLCAHGAKHLFERLEWICDIDRAIRTDPKIDWPYLIHEAEKLGIKRMLYLGLVLSQHFFKVELPMMITEEMQKDEALPALISKIIEINFSDNSQAGKSYSSFGLLLSMRENFSDKLRFTWRGLFTPKFDDFVFIQLPKHLAFLYPVVRPYRLLTKYFKR